MGSGKISSSPFSTPPKMARATDSGAALGMSKPRVMSVSMLLWFRAACPAAHLYRPAGFPAVAADDPVIFRVFWPA